MSYRNSEGGVSVSLGEGFGEDSAGGSDDFDPDNNGVAHIDGVVGSQFTDFLGGGSNSQDVSGRKIEFFEGLGGLDFIDGGDDFVNGFDRVDYVRSPFKVVVNLGTDVIVGNFYGSGAIGVGGGTALDGWSFTGGSIDIFDGIEDARGSEFDDVLRGGLESNRFEGMGGNDTLDGNSGAAIDWAVYSQSTEAVFASLEEGVAHSLDQPSTGGVVGFDTLLSIEGLIGSDQADSLVGGDGNGQPNVDVLEGAAGNDTLDGGTISGELDLNVASYGGSPNGVIANMGNVSFDAGGGVTVLGGTARDGYGDTDTLVNINALQGSSFDDTLVGGAGPSDWVFYGNDPGNVFVQLGPDTENPQEGDADDGWVSFDRLFDIENVVGSAFDDDIIGNGENNILDGGEGFDFLEGGGGADTFVLRGTVDGSNIKDIADFTRAEGDKIYLDGRDFFGLSDGPLTAAQFANVDVDQILPSSRILYDSEFGILYFDPDGSGGSFLEAPIVFFDGIPVIGFPEIQASDIVVFNELSNTLVWSELANGSTHAFDPILNQLVFDGGISAADLEIDSDGTNTIFIHEGKTVTLLTAPYTLTQTNVTFDNGSRLVIGDNATTLGDDGPNTLTGTGNDDMLIGAGGNDSVSGGGGDDLFPILGHSVSGLFGSDTINGGSGRDRIVFLDSNGGAGVVVNMTFASNTLTAREASQPLSVLTLTNVEGVVGSEAGDALTGAPVPVNGLRGDITLRFEGRSGNDTINGATGDGRNTIAEYAHSPSGVFAVLGGLPFVSGPTTVVGGTALDGYGNIDTFNNVDGLVGSDFADTLVGGSSSRSISGGLFESFEGLAGDDVINGRNGTDRVIYDNSPNAVNVNLATGTAADGHGGTDILTSIEHVRGSDFNDTLIGSDNGSDEAFEGLGGDDTINGAGGFDEVRYQRSTTAVSVNLGAGTASDGMGGTDTLANIEAAMGSDFNDVLTGGGAGEDSPDRAEFFEGRAGKDTLDGGDLDPMTLDVASYRRDPSGAIVNLGATNLVVGTVTVTGGTARDGYFANANADRVDTLVNINAAEGSSFNDTLVGGAGNEFFSGGAGNDSMNGGSGIDTLFYDPSGNNPGAIINMLAGTAITVGSVTVAAGTARDNFGGIDTISGFENVVGGFANDFIMGNSLANRLEGLEGSDTLVGGGPAVPSGDFADDTLLGGEGDDFLRLSRGHDLLDGGEGFDWVQFVSSTGASATGVVYAGGTGAYVNLGEYVANPDRNTLNPANNAELVNMEAAVGTAGADLLVGGGFASADSGTFSEAFRPGAGNDTVHGNNSRTGSLGVVDRVDYTDMGAGVIVNFGVQPVVSGAITVQGGTARDALGGIDTLIDIDWAVGSSFNDLLVGGNPKHSDFERFEGRAGNDTLIGGAGGDEAAYHNSPTAVHVDLGLGIAADGHGGTDTLISINRVRGSAFGDTLLGRENPAGTTEFFIGDGGNDFINGGAGPGLDFASWQTSPIENGGLHIFLENGSATIFQSPFGSGIDTLIDIEGIVGTNYHGGDTLTGGDGDQTFMGRAGNDILDGGNNSPDGDTARYSGDPSAVIVNLSGTDAVVNIGPGNVTVAGGTARDGWGDTWLVPHGDVLTLGISGEGAIDFRRVGDPASAIVGSWHAINAGDAQSTVVITFLSDGTYMLAEDGDSIADPSGQDGMERGTYTWNSGTGAFTRLTTVNTNGEWGLSDDPPNTVVVSGDGATLTMDGAFVLTRVTDPSNPLVGGWYLDEGDGGNFSVVTFLADGTSFLMAEDEGFPDPAGQPGMERGTYTVDPETGAFDAVVTVDTTGDFGVSTLRHGIDTLTNIENAFGSRFNDILVSGTAVNRLSGFDGDDEFWIRGDGIGGASGNDTLDGGAGHDHLSYQNDQGVPLDVNFQIGTVTGGEDDGSTLIISSIESAAGTNQGDTFTANSTTTVNGLRADAMQEFQGMAGDDTLIGAQGQAHATLAAYFDSPFAVVVNLSNGSLDGTPYGSVAANRARDGWDSLGGGTDVFDTTNGANIDGAYGSAHDDILFGGQFGSASINLYTQFFEGMGGDDTIVGGEEGNHALVSYEHSDHGVEVDLGAGTASDGIVNDTLTGAFGTDTLVNIRHVRGSAFDDSLVGANEDREEWFEGGDGDDTIEGGAQGDNVLYTQATGGVFVSLAAGIGRALDTIGGARVGVDELKNIEFIHGSDFADSLIGGGAGGQPGPGQSLADFESWESALFFGSEEIQGRAGNDTIDGGDTNAATLDITEYRSSPGAVIVNLSAATAFGVGSNRANDGYGVNGNPAGIDVLVRINGAGGSQFNDTLVGGAGNEFFAGRGGNDTIIGGAGIDIASYESGGSVTVNLGTGFNLEGVFVDSLSGIENILGSSFNDTIFGDNGINLLIGEGGDDVLFGGDSTVSGGANDTLFGGEGDDQFTQSRGKDHLIGGEGTNDRLFYNVGALAAVNVNLAAGTSNAAGHIASVSGIENIFGTTGNDTLAGGDPLHAPGIEGGIGEVFRPLAGNDTVTGMAGAGWRTIVDYGTNSPSQGITAVLGNSNNVGFIFDGLGGLDTLVDVDEVRGGAGDDSLIGGSYASSVSGTFFESFRGNAGNDTLDGGGSDTVLGSLGTLDRAEYSQSQFRVVANLRQDDGANDDLVGDFYGTGVITVSGGQARDGTDSQGGGFDTLIDIDVLQGGLGDDILVGGNPDNDSFERFEGRAGNDFAGRRQRQRRGGLQLLSRLGDR